MKFCSTVSVLLLAIGTHAGVLDGFFSRENKKNDDNAIGSDRENNSLTFGSIGVNNRSLEKIIRGERRFVLYNSRRLQGECLPICYEDSPTAKNTFMPSNSPTKITIITEKPSSRPTRSTDTPTEKPVVNPTGVPTVGIVPPTPDNKGEISCEELQNLGYGWSGATGPNAHQRCYPHIHTSDNAAGTDDSIALFVGGDYFSHSGAAEIEGKIVILGSWDQRSLSSVVGVGGGSQVNPSSGPECIIIGGDLKTTNKVDVHHGDRSCSSVIVKGEVTNPGLWDQTTVKVEPNYDLSYYEKHKENLLIKSKFWATLPTTPGTSVTEEWGEVAFKCSSEDEIQVFNLQKDYVKPSSNFRFKGNNCLDKTILINVQGTGKILANGYDMYDPKGGYGFLAGSGFDTCMIPNILWNFPDAANVEIKGWSEWQGSLLVTGNLKFDNQGHSGRTIVLGNMEHTYGGSELHNYPFDPPKPLPDPDCEDFMAQAPSTKHTYPPAEPTTPTKNPTKATSAPEPENTPSQPGCVPIPYCDSEPGFPGCLPRSIGKPSNNDCKACIGGGRTWDPCAGRQGKPVCYGDDCVLY